MREVLVITNQYKILTNQYKIQNFGAVTQTATQKSLK